MGDWGWSLGVFGVYGVLDGSLCPVAVWDGVGLVRVEQGWSLKVFCDFGFKEFLMVLLAPYSYSIDFTIAFNF